MKKIEPDRRASIKPVFSVDGKEKTVNLSGLFIGAGLNIFFQCMNKR
jgi:hypothetical protein